MACSCGGSSTPSTFSYNFTNRNCTTCSNTCSTDSSTILYSGPALTCLNLPTGTYLQEIIEALDAQICLNDPGNWDSFNYYCVTDPNGDPIITQEQFVEGICFNFCNLEDDFTTFSTVTYVDGIADLQDQIDTLAVPGLNSCSAVGIISSDTMITVLTKLASNLCQVNDAIDPSTANWNSCYVVTPAPTTVITAFNALILQICTLKATVDAGFALPTINNSANCLAGTTTDTFVDTFGLLTTYICTLPTFDVDLLTFGCVEDGTDLQETIQNTLDQLAIVSTNYLADADPTYFTLDWVDSGNHCLGKILGFDPALVGDRYVASNSSDMSPGTLFDKLTEGSGITLDFLTTPGSVIISAVPVPTYTVLTSSTDSTPGYLLDKIIPSTLPVPITITVSEDISDLSDHKTVIGVNIDSNALAADMLATIQANATLYTIFCEMVSGCISTCPAPIDLAVTHPTTSTTTSTTSSTTTTTTTLA